MTAGDPGDPIAGPIAALHAERRLRVWSLVVTVFGDAAAPRGGRMPAAALTAITGRLGVGAGAARTALSRLVADGTLTREREGRASFHRLSPAAAAEVAAASRLIYGAPGDEGPWTIGVGPAPRRSLPLPGGAWLSRGSAPDGAAAVTGALSGAASVAPEPPHARALAALAADLDALEAVIGGVRARSGAPADRARSAGVDPGAPARPSGAPTGAAALGAVDDRRWGAGGASEVSDAGAAAPPRGRVAPADARGGPSRTGVDAGPRNRAAAAGRAASDTAGPAPVGAAPGAPCPHAPLDPLTAMAARALLIHRWRRLTLRWPDLPAEAHPPAASRARVAGLYRALLPASEGWLDAVLPPAGPAVRARFGG